MFTKAIEPTAISWPYARALLCIESRRGTKKKPGLPERRYFVTSLEPHERPSADWINLVRNHWAGVEIRNHWRKDACWREDHTRSRNRNIVAILSMLRNALLALIVDQLDTYHSLPAFFETCQARPALPLRLIRRSL